MSEATPGSEPKIPARTVEPADDEISFAAVAAVLLNGRRVILASTATCMVLGALFGLLSTKKYEATAKFVPQAATSQLSSLASLAGQFGVQLPTTGAQDSQSPDFYQQLLTARAILAPVVGAKYQVRDSGADGDSVALLDLVEIKGDTRKARLARGINWIQDEALSTSVDRQSGIVTLNVSTRWPEVSYEIASALLSEIHKFNLQTRQSQARAEREFLEGRVEAAHQDLQLAEDSLQAFLEKNRQYSNSPELTFQFDRLQRQVTMRQQLYTSLSQSYEQARIQEVQNTPVITILERPIVPPLREPRRTALKTLVGVVLGGMLGIGIVFGRHAFDGGEDPEAVALKDAWADTKEDLRRLTPWRRGAREA